MGNKGTELVFPCVNNKEFFINSKDILYFESEEKLSVIHYMNRLEVESKYLNLLLKEVESKKLPSSFFRCHKSFLVNLDFILPYGEYPKETISLSNGSTVQLSRRKKQDFHKAYLSYTKSIRK